jgi:Holliday junction resolvase RusA-like endonuclease
MVSEPEHISSILPRVMPLILTLPEPPSANRWWRRAGTHIHLSNEAKAYKLAAAQTAGVNGATLFPTEALSVVVVWHRQKKTGDLDKRLGVLLDVLQQRKQLGAPPIPGVYATDAQIVQIWARRCDAHPEIPKGHVRIEICPTPVDP